MAESKLELQLKSGRCVRAKMPPLPKDFIESLVKQTIEAGLENPQEYNTLTDEEILELYTSLLQINDQYWSRTFTFSPSDDAEGSEMQMFYDEELTKPLGKKGVDLGENWFLEAHKRTVWLYNPTEALLRDIQVDVDEKACVKVEAPKTLKSKECAPVTFTWKPETLNDLKAEFTVHAFKVSAIAVYDH